jgi:coenzyme F420-reducing hydrogenase delta subunit
MKIIRVMCTGRVDLAFILRAFINGADGVLIGGCWPGECHYITGGNYGALANVHLCRKLMRIVGLDPQRLRIEWLSAAEGSRFAEVVNDFVGALRELGPLAEPQGSDAAQMNLKLEAATRLIPYIKLVEREKLRVSPVSEARLKEFYSGVEADRLFDGLIAEKLTMGQILLLLEKGPLATTDIAAALSLSPSEVSKHMNDSSRLGVVRYDVDRRCYALA